ncbi:MAG: hypothetical protein OXG61_11305, partial [Chloroflexi bacterium]|nr:hypothetical protein [Chloroflexota bacterium]
MIELLLGDLLHHVEADGPVLLRLDTRQLPLRARDILAGGVAIRIAIEGREPCHDQVRVLQYAPDLAPDEVLEPLRPDHRMLAAAQAVGLLRPVALVVALRRIVVVAVGL